MTVGSRSTKIALGTCFPAPVSLKKVLKESSPPPIVLSEGICPSGWIPCSRQYSSQHALPIWAPAWPTWMEIHSRCREWAILFSYQKHQFTFYMSFTQNYINFNFILTIYYNILYSVCYGLIKIFFKLIDFVLMYNISHFNLKTDLVLTKYSTSHSVDKYGRIHLANHILP